MSEFAGPRRWTFSYSTIILIGMFCLLQVLSAFMPRIMGVGPGAAGLICLIAWRFEQGQWPPMDRGGFAIGAAVIALAALSALWSMDGAFALERSVKIALVILPSLALVSLARAQGAQAKSTFARWFYFAVMVAGLVCAVDLYSEGAIYHLSHERDLSDADFNYSNMNRQVNIFTLCAMGAGYGIYKYGAAGQARVKGGLIAALAVLTGLVLYKTHSQSAQVAIALGLLIALAFPVGRRKAWILSAVLIVAGMLAAPWIAQWMYHHLASSAMGYESWIHQSYAAPRMEIWDYVSRKALESPLFGHGIEATRHVERFDTPLLYSPTDHVLHPHNAVVQVWMEFGLVGILGFAALVGYLLRQMSRLPRAGDRRCALALFTGAFFMMNTTYGLWQGWWLGLLFYLLAVAVMLCDHEENQPQ